MQYTSKPSKAAREDSASKKLDKARQLLAEVQAWQEINQEVWVWMRDNAATFGFAQSMLEALYKFGGLTDGQMNACKRCIDGSKARAAAKAEEAAKRVQNAPQVASEGVDRLKAAFDKAIAYSAEKGLKRYPKITIGCMVIQPAKAHSKNPGALYVTDGGTYLGKVAEGKFFASRECSDDQQGKVVEFIKDPQKASEVYGQETGTCCVCNATLTSEWKFRGIGPICAEKFGW